MNKTNLKGQEPAIRIRNLTKDYGPTRAVSDVSFDVARGQILGFLGPNGAGKTTTMRIITGFLTATRGTVQVAGMDVTDDPVGVKARIGYLPELAPLYGEMLVYEYLRLVARLRGLDHQTTERRIKRLVRTCGLKEVIHRPIRELSRGYRQRAGLAHAMIGDPDILVLDEPTAGLDPNQIVEIRSIIREIGREKTVIFSTHILSEAEAICDRVIIINGGRIVADGLAEELKARAAGGMIIRLTLADAVQKDVQARLQGIDGVERLEKLPAAAPGEADAIRIQLLCRSDLRRTLYGVIKSQDWTLLELAAESRSLEDVFQQLTLDSPQQGEN
jgi:ABC-2 type transport system ATP-binding protein